MAKIQTETLFENYSTLIPQDGSVESIQNYIYHPDKNIYLGNSEPLSRKVLRMERINKENPLDVPPLNLWPGVFLRVQCLRTYQYRKIKKVKGNIIELESSMNDDPLPGTMVRKVKGYAQHYIDMRLYDQLEKGKIQAVKGFFYKVN